MAFSVAVVLPVAVAFPVEADGTWALASDEMAVVCERGLVDFKVSDRFAGVPTEVTP